MSITTNIAQIKKDIRLCEEKYNRKPGSVSLLAVSKGQTASAIEQAMAAGQYHFAENYLQEAVKKIAAIQSKKIKWHFTGTIQSNKIKIIAKHFSWVHTIVNAQQVVQLQKYRANNQHKLNVFIQMNITQSEQRLGPQSIEELIPIIKAIKASPSLEFQGLMAMPPCDYKEKTLDYFNKIQAVKNTLKQQANIDVHELSMGMSADYKLAIQAGSTLIRVGTAIFGSRT